MRAKNGIPSVSYEYFVEAVKVYRTNEIIPKLAMLPPDWADLENKGEAWLTFSPWAAMAIVRESIIRSNNHRPSRNIEEQNLRSLGLIFNTVHEKMGKQESNKILRILSRVSNQQFGFQESDYEEIARTIAIFENIDSENGRKLLHMFKMTFGCSPSTLVDSCLIIWAVVRANNGIWDAALLDSPELSDLANSVGVENICSVARHITVNQKGFSFMQAKLPKPKKMDGSVWQGNALIPYPLLELEDERIYAPINRLILKRCSPKYLSVDCQNKYKEDFTSLLGEVVEEYVGKQLNLLENNRIRPSFRWKVSSNTYESIDWILETKSVVILFEVKSGRAPLPAQMGEDELVSTIERNFKKAINQINQTYFAIQNNLEIAPDISRKKKFVGVIVTLDSWYLNNSLATRELLPTCEIPYLSLSVRELESLMPNDADQFADEVLKIAIDPELSTWTFNSASTLESKIFRNPLLDEAANSLKVFANVAKIEND